MSQANGWSGWPATRARAYWKPRVANGDVECWRCGRLIDPTTQPWDTGHRDDLATGGARGVANQAPEHTACNRRAGQALGVARRVARTRARKDSPRGIRAWV